jgi:hypothetical protein
MADAGKSAVRALARFDHNHDRQPLGVIADKPHPPVINALALAKMVSRP